MSSDTASEPCSRGEEFDSSASYALSSQPSSSRMEDEEDQVQGADEDGVEEEADDPDTDPLEPVAGQVRLVPSVFQGRQPTIFFDYPSELGETRGTPFVVQPLNARKLAFATKWERNCVKNAFARAGFERVQGKGAWNANWGKHPTHKELAGLNRFQKINHFPSSWCIGRKDRLMRTLQKFRRSHGPTFHFHPEGFQLPVEKKVLEMKVKAEKSIWIIKPSASSCGRGIRLIHQGNLNTLPSNKAAVVQRYVERPYLINGHKFDLRLYVVLTSVDPLRIYLFEHGLVRFSTHKYTLKNLKSRFTHLTNYSVNKKSKHFVANEDPEQDGTGSKWSLGALWRHFEGTLGKERTEQVKEDIKAVIVKTLIAAEGDITPSLARLNRTRGVCYELFGFDVLLDAALKPWLVEVNISPSLMGTSPLDRQIKGQLMADVFHLVGFVPYDERALRKDQKAERSNKLRGVTSGKAKQQLARRQDSWRRNPTPESIDLSELRDDDWDVVYESMDEFQRTGHFERIYPTASRVDEMLGYFQSTRFNDVLLARLVKSTSLRKFLQHSPRGLPSFLASHSPNPSASPHLPSPPRQKDARSFPSPRPPRSPRRGLPADSAAWNGGGGGALARQSRRAEEETRIAASRPVARTEPRVPGRGAVQLPRCPHEDSSALYFLDPEQSPPRRRPHGDGQAPLQDQPLPRGAGREMPPSSCMKPPKRPGGLTVNLRMARVEDEAMGGSHSKEPDPTPIMTMEPDELFGTPLEEYFSTKLQLRGAGDTHSSQKSTLRSKRRPTDLPLTEAAMANSVLSAAGNRQIRGSSGSAAAEGKPRVPARRGSGSRNRLSPQVLSLPPAEDEYLARRHSFGSARRGDPSSGGSRPSSGNRQAQVAHRS
uniref:Tubulin--tyrosine ligase-like protein 5 n=1 Tax=Rhizochromulina marina TaxID=1034831 RepID=A0A7S2RSL0_9STRA